MCHQTVLHSNVTHNIIHPLSKLNDKNSFIHSFPKKEKSYVWENIAANQLLCSMPASSLSLRTSW